MWPLIFRPNISLVLSLYKERQVQVEEKLKDVRVGKAPEYLQPLSVLQDDMRVSTQVAGT